MKNYFFFILLINYCAIVTYILILSIKKNSKKGILFTIFNGFNNHINCYLTTIHMLGPFYSFSMYYVIVTFSSVNPQFDHFSVISVNLTNRLLCVWGKKLLLRTT